MQWASSLQQGKLSQSGSLVSDYFVYLEILILSSTCTKPNQGTVREDNGSSTGLCPLGNGHR
jgi:hypothetical protein